MRPANALVSVIVLQQAFAFSPSLFGTRCRATLGSTVDRVKNEKKSDIILRSGIGYLSDYYDFYEKGKDKNRDDGDDDDGDIEEEELDVETLAKMEEEGEEEEIELDEIIVEKPGKKSFACQLLPLL